MDTQNIWELLARTDNQPLPEDGISEQTKHLRWQYTVMTAILAAQRGDTEPLLTLRQESPDREFSVYDKLIGDRQLTVSDIVEVGGVALHGFEVHQLIPVLGAA